jgi:hypothetical protein
MFHPTIFLGIFVILSILIVICNPSGKSLKKQKELRKKMAGAMYSIKGLPCTVRVLDIKLSFDADEDDDVMSALVIYEDKGNAFTIPVAMLDCGEDK